VSDLYAETRAVLAGEPPAEDRDRLALTILAILRNIQEWQAESDRRSFEAHARSCCRVCGSLFAGATCDVCRARLEVAS